MRGFNRGTAISAMQRALDTFGVGSLHTTIPVYQAVLAHSDFMNGSVSTRWVKATFRKADALTKESA